MLDKPVVWLGSSRVDVRAFSEEARQEAGYQLRRVQQGLPPTDWRPMNTIGAGVAEIRIHTSHEYRVVYVAKFAEAVYVLHAFVKKTPKTAQRDIEMAQHRYAEIRRIRNRNRGK
jgi:phage-related protein